MDTDARVESKTGRGNNRPVVGFVPSEMDRRRIIHAFL